MNKCHRCGLEFYKETNGPAAMIGTELICGNCEYGNMSLDKENLEKCKQYHLRKWNSNEKL